MNRFQNKNVLVTGAASGIGRAAALQFAIEGASLALLDVDLVGLEQTVQALKMRYLTPVMYASCNVAHPKAVKECIGHFSEKLGGLHALSHNVGVLRSYHTHEMTAEEWNEILSVNLSGTFYVNRYALPQLLKNKSSYIVNTASCAHAQPHPWLAAYAATKGGIVSFTRSLSLEYSLQGLHANCILPGGTDTPLAKMFSIPDGGNPILLSSMVRFGRPAWIPPEKVATAIAFLASEDASHVNGTELLVDGAVPVEAGSFLEEQWMQAALKK